MGVDIDRLSAVAEQLPGALIALDFDGTLAPIVRDPTESRPVRGTVETLTALAENGAQVAIVTGRDALTVLELGQLAGIPRLVVSGLHGAETWQGGQLLTRDEPPGLTSLRRELPELLAQDGQGAWLEDKRLSLVVHTRTATDPERALAALAPRVQALAESEGLEVHPGKLVLEIRIPGLSKATALNALLTGQTTAVLFAGDDLGDLPAVHAIREWADATGHPAVTIAVGEVAELAAVTDLAVDSPASLSALLSGLLGLWG
jgi:trehalose 6-phosphate phosphatase